MQIWVALTRGIGGVRNSFFIDGGVEDGGDG